MDKCAERVRNEIFYFCECPDYFLQLVQHGLWNLRPLIASRVTLGQALHPINEMVGQFAELMLAACVAFAAMKFLIVIGGANGVSLLLSSVALWWSWLRWRGKPRPSLLSNTLLFLVFVRFAVPVVSVGSELIFQQLLADDYKTAQAGITDISSLDPSVMNGVAGIEGNAGAAPPNAKHWWSKLKDIHKQVDNLKQSAEKWVRHIIDLIVLFLLQTLVVPLFLFWILYRVASGLLDSSGRRRTEGSALTPVEETKT